MENGHSWKDQTKKLRSKYSGQNWIASKSEGTIVLE